MESDRNLLFGVLALQAGLIDASQFARACSLWSERRPASLADILVELGYVGPADRNHIEQLLPEKPEHADGTAMFRASSSQDGAGSRAAPAHAEIVEGVFQSVPPAPASPALPGAEPSPGAEQRYDLTEMYAVGGMGRIWLARDTRLHRNVALKELRPEVATDAAVRNRFLREAQITGQLEHPGIVPVYEVAQHGGTGEPFYTMRFVRGRTLAEASRHHHHTRQAGQANSLELVALLSAFVAVCHAIAYAHSQRIVHRDLKGENIILGDFGEVIVLDWGLAKQLDSPDEPLPLRAATVSIDPLPDSYQTIQGDVIGTPGYMAPEQAEGRLDLIDHRTDIYGLGAILYEILTGQPPFVGSTTFKILGDVLNAEPAAPHTLWPEVPPALEAACLQALAKKPADRYTAASELAQAVQTWQEVQRRQAEDALRKQTAILQSILDNMSESVLVADEHGQLLLLNPAAERMLGVRAGGTLADASGRYALYRPDGVTSYPPEQLPMARALRGETADDVELFVRVAGQADGLWLSANARPLTASAGREQAGLVVIRDITERRRADEEVRRSRERFELAVLGSQDGFWDWDLRTDEVYFSPRWKSILGYEDHEITHHLDEWASRLHPEEKERVIAANRAHIDGLTPHYEYEYRLRHKDGSFRWILARGVALRDATGKAYRMAGSHVDVTARKQAELDAQEREPPP